MDPDRRAPEPQTNLKGLTVGEKIEELARFVARTGWDDMPEAVHRRAKLVLLDTIGVTLAGAARPEVMGLSERLLAGAGRGATFRGATVIAPGLPQADTRTAALLNGIAARAVELCEGSRGLQPSPHILPGVLAIAEQSGLGGRAMLGAFVLGYEVAGRLNRGYTPRAFSHPNGQLSLLGAAAAGARLHELDGAGVSLAMRVATTMLMTPSYNNTVAGGTTLNLPAGLGAVAATLAPEMAASRLRGAGRRDRGGARRHGGRGLRRPRSCPTTWGGGGRSWRTISASTPAAIRSMPRSTAWPRPWPC